MSAIAALAGGDWSPLLQYEDSGRTPVWRKLLRRVGPGIALGGVALALPWIPGVGLSGTQLETVRAFLVIGAILSLTSFKKDVRDSILDGFSRASLS